MNMYHNERLTWLTKLIIRITKRYHTYVCMYITKEEYLRMYIEDT